MPKCSGCGYKKVNYGGLYCYHPEGLTGDLSKYPNSPKWCPLLKLLVDQEKCGVKAV